jgi:hypothetical protein
MPREFACPSRAGNRSKNQHPERYRVSTDTANPAAWPGSQGALPSAKCACR